MIQKGDTILAEYKVESDPAEGTLGRLFRVRHTGWNMNLAMRQPHPDNFQTKRQKGMLIQGYKAWISMELHANIETCYIINDVDGIPYLFSEWMDGGNLETLIKNEVLYIGSYSTVVKHILDIAIQFARGLNFLHKQGFIHHNVKPSNLLFSNTGIAKLSSLECCAPLFDSYSPAYSSIEQQRGEKLTHHTDIWSWALSVLEMFLGNRPWQTGAEAAATCRDYFETGRIAIPVSIKDLLSQCLKENETDRPFDFAEIENKLYSIYQAETGKPYSRPQPELLLDTADRLNNKALSSLALGKPQDAKKYWELALSKFPDHAECLYNSSMDNLQTANRIPNHFLSTETTTKNIKLFNALAVEIETLIFQKDIQGALDKFEELKKLRLFDHHHTCDELQAQLIKKSSPDTDSKTVSKTASKTASKTVSKTASETNLIQSDAAPESVQPSHDDVSTDEEDVPVLKTYQIESKPFKGGMGFVFRVRHNIWNVKLAMKQPYREKFQTEEDKKTFTEECRRWIDLGLHPHIVSCYYVREIDGIPSIFSEWMDEGSLKDWIGEPDEYGNMNGKLYEGNDETVLERILNFSIQMAWGLNYAHKQNLIHNDVKPANLLLSLNLTVKIADFGIAHAIASLTDETNRHELGYTPAYCSPEQKEKRIEDIKAQTDIWSWAVSVLEMFVGQRQWFDGTIAGLACEEYFDMAYIPIPESMKDLLRHCFQINPKERPRDFSEIGKQLLEIYSEVTGKTYARTEPETVAETTNNLNNKALSFLDLDDPEEAENCWAKALKIDPGHAESLYNRSVHLWRSKKIDDAEAIRLLVSNTVNVDYYLAKLHIARGDALSAIECLNKAKKIYGLTKPIENSFSQAQEMINNGLDGKCINTIEAHTHSITALCFSPDGKKVLSGSSDYSIKLWDITTGECLNVYYRGFPNSINAVCFSPDGKMALIGGGNIFDMELWDLSAGKCIRQYKGHTKDINEVCFNSNGSKALSGSSDNTVKLWDVQSGKCIFTFDGHRSCVTSVCFSPDGTKALSGGWDRSMMIWDIITRKCIRSFKGHKGLIETVCFDPSGDLALSGSRDHTMKLYDISTRRLINTFEGHTDHIYSACFSPDGTKVFSGSKDGSLKFWDVETGKCIRTFEGTKTVNAVCCSPDGHYILTGDSEGKLKLWNMPKVERSFEMVLSNIHSTEIAVKQTELFNSLVREIDSLIDTKNIPAALNKLEELRSIWVFGNTNTYYSVIRRLAKFCILGNHIVNQTVKKIDWNVDVKSFCLSPDGNKALLGIRNWDKPMELWDLSTGQCCLSFEGNNHPVCTVCMSPDGKHALSGSLDDETMRLWDVSTGKCLHTFIHTDNVRNVCFSPDNKFAVSSQDNILRLWDVQTRECLRSFEGHRKPISSVCFSPDGSLILSGSFDNTLKLWNTATGAFVWSFEEHSHAVISVCFSPDGKRALSGGWDNKLKLWDISTRSCVDTIEVHTGNIGFVCFSPDGSKIISVDRNHTTIYLWDLASGTCIHIFEGFTLIVEKTGFSPDGRQIVAATNKKVHIYNLDYDLSFPGWNEWDERAHPFLDTFLAFHPKWTNKDFNNILIPDLQNHGFGWLRPEGVKTELMKMSRKTEIFM